MLGARPILTEFAYPQHVGWVPMKLFGANFGVSVLLMILLRNVAQGIGIFVALALFAGVHAYIAIRFRRDPFVEQVWIQYVMPPDFTKPGQRRVLRAATRNQRLEAGRKYTV